MRRSETAEGQLIRKIRESESGVELRYRQFPTAGDRLDGLGVQSGHTLPRWGSRPPVIITLAHDSVRGENPMTAVQPETQPAARLQHPVVVGQRERRAANLQLRVADAITKFAGSMSFVYLHVVVFAVWMLFVESSPWPTLTLVVSLEAIFLSTLVMIGQNRAAAFQQAKADHDFTEQDTELKTNTQLTREIHILTTELHRRILNTP